MASGNVSMWDEFHNAYINCFALLLQNTSSNNQNIHESDEIKASVEQSVLRFIDAGRAMDAFFLQKRLMFATQKPEQVIMEEIGEIDNEIKRKEDVIRKFYEKLEHVQTNQNWK